MRKGGLDFFCVALDELRHLFLNLDGQPSEDPCPPPQQPSSVRVKGLLSSSPGAGVWGFASYPRGMDTFLDPGARRKEGSCFYPYPSDLVDKRACCPSPSGLRLLQYGFWWWGESCACPRQQTASCRSTPHGEPLQLLPCPQPLLCLDLSNSQPTCQLTSGPWNHVKLGAEFFLPISFSCAPPKAALGALTL